MDDVYTHERIQDWLTVLRLYLAGVLVGNLLWEIAQLPLYTIWHDATLGKLAFAVLHCTAGDVLIASASLLGVERYWGVATLAILGGVAYTLFSEWLNTEVRGAWVYTALMPRIPVFGTGVTPLAQWLLVPTAAFWWTRRRRRNR
jgi:hypothetical protein